MPSLPPKPCPEAKFLPGGIGWFPEFTALVSRPQQSPPAPCEDGLTAEKSQNAHPGRVLFSTNGTSSPCVGLVATGYFPLCRSHPSPPTWWSGKSTSAPPRLVRAQGHWLPLPPAHPRCGQASLPRCPGEVIKPETALEEWRREEKLGGSPHCDSEIQTGLNFDLSTPTFYGCPSESEENLSVKKENP